MQYFVDYLPITTGNELKLFVDGADYGRDLYGELNRAKKFIFLTGLHFMADYKLIRTGRATDETSAIGNVLVAAAKRGIEIYLLVNQFWKDEQEVGWTSPVRNKIMKDGELKGYLPETYKLFQMLDGFKNAHCRTDIHPNSDIFATHHQKTIVIDDRIAYLGGIDLTFLDGDRWDTPAHATPAGKPNVRATDRTQKYWHDVHMSVVGPAVEFVRDNFIQRWTYGHLHVLKKVGGNIYGVKLPDRILGEREKTRAKLPDFPASKTAYVYPTGKETAETSTVQIVRSMPNPVAVLPTEANVRIDADYQKQKPKWHKGRGSWERSAKDAYLIGIRAAKQYVYLENQWVADEDIWAELAAAAKRNKSNKDFRIIVMVPYEGLFAAGLGSNQELWIGSEMEKVMKSGYDERVFGMYGMSKYRKKQGQVAGQIYVHSKVLIVDDEWSLIGSANAGGISLEGMRTGRDEPDTELSAIILDKTFGAAFRQKLWSEHLERPISLTYDVHEADLFRIAASKKGERVSYFPGYEKIKQGLPTWTPGKLTPSPGAFRMGSTIDPRTYRAGSRIVPTFPDRLRYGIPPTLVRAAFKAEIVPALPPGWRAWYRWAVDLGYTPATGAQPAKSGTRLRMRSLKYDADDVWDYSDQDTAYIGQKSAQFINAQTKDVSPSRVLCRVQFTSADEGPIRAADFVQSLLLEYDCLFMNEDFARANHPDFVTRKP